MELWRLVKLNLSRMLAQGPECTPVTDAFMARFPFPSQLQEFAESPPVQALLDEERRLTLPLHAEYILEFETAPPQKSQERSQEMGLRSG